MVKSSSFIALAFLALALASCVVYPNNGYYASGYGGGYYAPAPVYVAPPPVVFGFGYGGGWGGRRGYWR